MGDSWQTRLARQDRFFKDGEGHFLIMGSYPAPKYLLPTRLAFTGPGGVIFPTTAISSATEDLPEACPMWSATPYNGAALSTRSETMSNDFSVIIERDADGIYVASVPALRGCHTQGTSLDQVMERIREAIALCIEEQGGDAETLDFVGIQ